MTVDEKTREVRDKDIRWFGVIMLVGLSVVGLIIYRKATKAGSDAGAAPWVLASVGAVICVASLTAPRAMVPVYRAWMLLGQAMGAVVSRVILMAVFYGCMTPMSLVMRLTGRDRLKRRFEPEAETYWAPRDPPPDRERYARQF